MKQPTASKNILFLGLFVLLFLGYLPKTTAQTNVTLAELSSHMNRTANKLTDSKQAQFPLATKGFTWDSDDSKTQAWFPQGISGLTEDSKEYVLVSWYGKSAKNYGNRGARVSILDVSDMTNIKYRHVLLVQKDKDGKHKTFYDSGKEGDKGVMHAGGIAVIGKKLHVADSRKGHRCIRVFDLDKIKKLDVFKLKYEFVLEEEYSYKVPITPSYMSYDQGKKEILIGKFNETPSDCKPNYIAWIKPPTSKNVPTHNNNIGKILIHILPKKYKKIQGASSTMYNGKQILWLSTSYGRNSRSNFYKLYLDDKFNAPTFSTTSSSTSKKYPPGFEGTHLSTSSELWMLTEFPYDYGEYISTSSKKGDQPTRRVVFAIPQSQILP